MEAQQIRSADVSRLNVGDRVECAVGNLADVAGVMAAPDTDGRIRVAIAKGVYLELPSRCARRVELARPDVD
jgi:hypothetical protein